MIYDDVFLKSWDFQKLDSYQPGAAPLNQATMGWSAGAPCVHWHLTLGRMVIMVKRAGLSGVRMCQNMPNTWSKDKQTIGWYICICLYIYYYYIYIICIYIMKYCYERNLGETLKIGRTFCFQNLKRNTEKLPCQLDPLRGYSSRILQKEHLYTVW